MNIINGKKGAITSILADFGAYVAFIIVVIIFYGLFTVQGSSIKNNKINNEITSLQTDLKIGNQLIAYLQTPVNADGSEIRIADFIALSEIDSAKKESLKKTILQTMDEYFGTSTCVIMCINNGIIKGNGCPGIISLQSYICPSNSEWIPSYSKNPIKISFDTDTQSINSQDMPVS